MTDSADNIHKFKDTLSLLKALRATEQRCRVSPEDRQATELHLATVRRRAHLQHQQRQQHQHQRQLWQTMTRVFAAQHPHLVCDLPL